MAGAQSPFKPFVVGAIICLQAIVENDVAISARAVWHIVEGSGFLFGDNCCARFGLHVVEAGARLRSLVVAQFVQTAIGKGNVLVAAGAISRVGDVLGVIGAVNRGA